jgi:plastocyanin
MNSISRFATISLLAAGLSGAPGANIIGTVALKGTPPPEKELPVEKDPLCKKLHAAGAKPTTRFYVAGPKGELADVFVTLTGVTGKSTGPSQPPVVVDQKGCEYVPYILGVQTGQKILVRNSDPLLHNVHATPKAGTRNKEENKAQLAKSPDLDFVFPDAEEFLRFKCDVHPWMFAYICVVDHPYFDVTRKEGTFKISNVPPGKYSVKAAHRKAGEATKEVEVKDGDVQIEFVFDVK